MKNYKIILKALVTINANAKLQYICTILRVEALHQFDTLCTQEGLITTTHLNPIILGLGTYFPPVNTMSNQKRVMHHEMKRPRKV